MPSITEHFWQINSDLNEKKSSSILDLDYPNAENIPQLVRSLNYFNKSL
jgi:hypothetical protein